VANGAEQAMTAPELIRVAMSTSNSRQFEANLTLLQQFRAASPERSAELDRILVGEALRIGSELESVRNAQREVRRILDLLTAPPYFPGVYVGRTDADPTMAVVRVGSEVRAVGFGENDPDEFQPGEGLLLSHEKNVIHSKMADGLNGCGETAIVLHSVSDNRLVMESRGDELVVVAAPRLQETPPKVGDIVRFDRSTLVAYEKMPGRSAEELFEKTPGETFDSVGGLDSQIEELKRSIELHLRYPEAVRRYHLRRKKAALFHGPPGNGKTLIARGLANWLGHLSGSGVSRFINIKTSELHSEYYSVSEANYRRVFRMAREVGGHEGDIPVVMFFDEIEAIGSIRGRSHHRIDDRVLSAFLTELNGLEDSGNILVVGATNRLGDLDPALTRPGRLGDLMLRIPRPNRKAARQIFEKHFSVDVPYASNGHPPDRTRIELIDLAVSMLFATNGDADLAHIMFSNGKSRTVGARDMINGSEIAAITSAAGERALLRGLSGGDGTVQPADVAWAVNRFLSSAAVVLTPENCREYIDDLTQDVGVVRVDLVKRNVQSHLYFNPAREEEP